jgi:predicted nucleotidyltransferase
MYTAMTVAEVREIALPILRQHGVTRAGVFGSCARGDMVAGSDIDILVEIRQDIAYWISSASSSKFPRRWDRMWTSSIMTQSSRN